MAQAHQRIRFLSVFLLFLPVKITLFVVSKQFSFAPPFLRFHPSRLSSSGTKAEWRRKRDELATNLLRLARDIGQVGMRTSESNRKNLERIARELSRYTDRRPAHMQLNGVHELIYSASTSGPQAGAVGPFVGKVTQTFSDGTTYRNAVRIGPIEFSIFGTREILDGANIKVSFYRTVMKIFGVTVLTRRVSGIGGVWKQIFVGEVQVTGKKILLRVMNTPKLFILKQVLD